jgi:hypothetical protein
MFPLARVSWLPSHSFYKVSHFSRSLVSDFVPCISLSQFWMMEQDFIQTSRTGDEAFLTNRCKVTIVSCTRVPDGLNTLRMGKRHHQDDPRNERRSTSRNADTITNVRKMVIRDCRRALSMTADELNINKEAIPQIPREVSRNRKMHKSSCHSDSRPSRSREDTSCQSFIQICQNNPSFL